MAREVGWYVRHRLGFESEYAQIAFWSAIAFPVWHVLISSAVFSYIASMWFFMLSVRYWYSSKPVSVFFFLLSMQLFSVFSMAVGFIACDYLLTATRANWLRKGVRGFGLSLAVLAGYVVFTSVISVNGSTGTYNVVSMDKVLKYGPLLVVYCAAIIAIGYAMSFKEADSGEREKLIRVVIGITALLFFAVLPYNAVGRPMRYFAFGSFTGSAHHAFRHSSGHAPGRCDSLHRAEFQQEDRDGRGDLHPYGSGGHLTSGIQPQGCPPWSLRIC